ncbi:phage integrase SAM-like domain-containing protein [uncultured Draconibacterium sp.]|uniref:phage integrase SAM-like domain-containing protein n=1 Tax=uncultured Draconibacterium sp. TaxID=1573823 RepID=UPI0025D1357C|nr:phage integrase SAM-like domain-containing protein [uncultured Draconibacterium sp.]
MATIAYFLKSERNPSNIYLKLSVKRGVELKRKSGYVIDPGKWNTDNKETDKQRKNREAKGKKYSIIGKTGFPKVARTVEDKQEAMRDNLKNLSDSVIESYNEAVKEGVTVNGEWLQEQIDKHHGKVEVVDVDSLVYQIQAYVDFLPRKKLNNGKVGASAGTIQKQKSLKTKIEQYQAYVGKKFKVSDISPKWVEAFEKYLFEVDKLNPNTSGRYVKHLKTVCRFASSNEVLTHKNFHAIRGYSVKRDVIYLTFEELDKIEGKTFEREALNNAKDWLIIGCYIGQRVSDLLNLTHKNLTTVSGMEMISLKQQKTGKQVMIPVHEKVKAILKKNNGKFPKKIADQKFNKHIKDVCEIAGIDEATYGGKMVKDKETKITRKQFGMFPKHELVSSHICRRSFASNFYGEIPTSLLKDITAHSTEQQFLAYIGKSSSDSALQVAEYWSKQAANKKKEPQMTVLGKAN